MTHFRSFFLLLTVLTAFAGILQVQYGHAQDADRKISKRSNTKLENREAKRLLEAIQQLLRKVAQERQKSRKLPSRKDYLIAVPPWTETKEDKAKIIRRILNSALTIITDGPVVKLQSKIKKYRKNIRTIRTRISALRERQLDVPKSSFFPFKETAATIESKIDDLKDIIKANEKEIARVRQKIRTIFKNKGLEMSDDQMELLLGSVLSGDIIYLISAFDAARLIDKRLGQLMEKNNENLAAARRYFAMHAALFAMLLHAQDETIKRIDRVYLKKLDLILKDLRKARRKTKLLLQAKNRPDQRRILKANLKAQDFSEQVAVFYRDYLLTQKRKLLESRTRTIHDLKIADNTYETVEATFQLRTLIEDARTTFRALDRLEAPGFDQIFKNDQLRREFEKLTDKLAVPSS